MKSGFPNEVLGFDKRWKKFQEAVGLRILNWQTLRGNQRFGKLRSRTRNLAQSPGVWGWKWLFGWFQAGLGSAGECDLCGGDGKIQTRAPDVSCSGDAREPAGCRAMRLNGGVFKADVRWFLM